MASTEPDLIGSSSSYDNSAVIFALDPDNDVYKWAKVLHSIVKLDDDGGYEPYLYFSPDGSKILATTIMSHDGFF